MAFLLCSALPDQAGRQGKLLAATGSGQAQRAKANQGHGGGFRNRGGRHGVVVGQGQVVTGLGGDGGIQVAVVGVDGAVTNRAHVEASQGAGADEVGQVSSAGEGDGGQRAGSGQGAEINAGGAAEVGGAVEGAGGEGGAGVAQGQGLQGGGALAEQQIGASNRGQVVANSAGVFSLQVLDDVAGQVDGDGVQGAKAGVELSQTGQGVGPVGGGQAVGVGQNDGVGLGSAGGGNQGESEQLFYVETPS